ncbi:MAG: hypothetical protein AAGJ85_04235 [Pseudomonadota bacterium]
MSDAAIAPDSAKQKPARPKKKARGHPPPWGRLLNATFLGYIATALSSAAITSILPISRAEATWASLLISGLIYVVIFIYVFAVKTWQKGLYVLLGVSVISALILSVTRWGII